MIRGLIHGGETCRVGSPEIDAPDDAVVLEDVEISGGGVPPDADGGAVDYADLLDGNVGPVRPWLRVPGARNKEAEQYGKYLE
jgi:hypothetical protein